MHKESPNPDQVAWTVKRWCSAADLSPSYCYELLAAGELRSAKVGGKRLILTSPREFVERHAEQAA